MREKIKQIAEKNLRPPTGEENKGDVAAAMLRGEIRAYVRGLKPAQRAALLHDPNPDPTIIGAILEAPAALTGFTQEQLDAARERLAIAANPEAAAKVAAFNEAVEVAVNARRAAVKEMAKATGLAEHEIERAALLAAGEKPSSLPVFED